MFVHLREIGSRGLEASAYGVHHIVLSLEQVTNYSIIFPTFLVTISAYQILLSSYVQLMSCNDEQKDRSNHSRLSS